MKKSGRCPKCNSRIIAVTDWDAKNARITIGFIQVLQTEFHVCCDCGYIEQWAEDEKGLEKLRKKRNGGLDG